MILVPGRKRADSGRRNGMCGGQGSIVRTDANFSALLPLLFFWDAARWNLEISRGDDRREFLSTHIAADEMYISV
jgi:hypothetical protein